MAKKDKFQQLQQGGGVLSSFQDIASTVAAVEKQADASSSKSKDATATSASPAVTSAAHASNGTTPEPDAVRYTHLPNPGISVREYNLASLYCSNFDNMTRQDWMELAIIEKLHNDGQMPDDEFTTRRDEIRNRPPRGQRKNTKTQTDK